MGIVYKAHDPALDRVVALKAISPDIEPTDDLKARFFREAQACAKLSHPNIVTVHELSEQEGHFFIVMEFLEGGDLREIIAGRRAACLADKVSLMTQMSDALQYAHDNGVIHRDIKPANILVTKDGHVKIVDFGIARIASAEAGLTRTGLVLGTLRYIAPEQIRGRGDHRADIFSLGTVCDELLTHRPPFSGQDVMELVDQIRSSEPVRPTDVNPNVPPDLSNVVERMLRKNPDQRYQNLAELRADLDEVRERFAGAAQQTRGPVRPRATALGGQARHQESGDSGDLDGREVAEDALKAMDRARRGAGSPARSKLAPDEWMKVASLEAQANAALDRGDDERRNRCSWAPARSTTSTASSWRQQRRPTLRRFCRRAAATCAPPTNRDTVARRAQPAADARRRDRWLGRFRLDIRETHPGRGRAIATVRSRSTPLSWRT